MRELDALYADDTRSISHANDDQDHRSAAKSIAEEALRLRMDGGRGALRVAPCHAPLGKTPGEAAHNVRVLIRDAAGRGQTI